MDVLKDIISDFDNIERKYNSFFSKKGFELFKYYIIYFITELYEESIRNANRYKNKEIDSIHVEKAAEYLTQKPRKKFGGVIKNISSITLGICISFALSPLLYRSNYYSGGNVLLIVLLIISIFGFIYSNLKF